MQKSEKVKIIIWKTAVWFKKIIEKMGICLENTAIYGTSAGGYLSIIMEIYLKGAKVIADNA